MSRQPLAFALLIAVLACSGGNNAPPPRGTWPPNRPGYVNPILAENALTGEAGWFNGREAVNHEIEGYLDRTSAHAGQTVQANVSADSAHSATWTLYRVGYYGGKGARRIAGGSFSVAHQAACPMDAATGMVRCAWTPSFALPVDPSWVSGLYVVRFARDDAFTSFAPLVVTDDRPADLLLQAAVNTYQAYNAWQGESLYADASGTIAGGMANQVSFDRPYASDRGSGQVLRYEALFARFLEQHGYDVTYTTNADVAAQGAALLTGRGAFLSIGHDEYWPGEVRDAVQRARDQGVPTLFFGANVGYWKVRMEDSTDPSNPRVMTCFKNFPAQDPRAADTAARTGRYRDDPIAQPENALVGTMYESFSYLSGPLLITDPSSFVFEGTGLAAGDTLPFMVGYEYDRVADNGASPAGLNVVAHSPVVDAYGRASWSDAVTYRTANGSLVFASGSIEWAYGLGQTGVADPRVARMTANVLHEALNLSVPPGIGSDLTPVTPVVNARWATSVQTVARGMQAPTAVVARPDGSFVIVDAVAQRVFEASAVNPQAVAIAGDGLPSKKAEYDDVPGLSARFNYPTGAVVLPSGEVIVADTGNHCLRRIANDATHTVSTVAGGRGTSGTIDGIGVNARFRDPMGLSLDPTTGDILVADASSHRIRRVNTTTWAVSTVAGSGAGTQDGPASTARFSYPTATAVAADGRIFFVASSDSRVIVIGTDAQHTLTTIAGGTRGRNDGVGSVATLAAQGGLAWTGTTLLVSEPVLERIRVIAPGATAGGTTVETLAGSGRFGHADGPGGQATLANPLGLAVAPDGSVLVANGGDGTVRRIVP